MELLEHLFKYVDYTTIKEIAVGFRSKSYLLDNRYVLLLGINKFSYRSYKNDIKCLEFLYPKIKSVELPKNPILIKKSGFIKYGGFVTDYISGQTMPLGLEKPQLKEIAKKMATFLNELHGVRVSFKREKVLMDEMRLIRENILALRNYITRAEYTRLLAWEETYGKLLNHTDFCIIHGDLSPNNLILDQDKKLKAVVDFERMNTLIPEIDFACLLDISEKFLDYAIKYYGGSILKGNVKIAYVRNKIMNFKNLVELKDRKRISQALEEIRNLEIFE